MKKMLLAAFCIACLTAGHAQALQGKYLDLNNIKAKINADGSLFTDYTNAQFEVPRGSGHNTIFASNLWIGGLDAGNQLKIAAQTYRQHGTDFFPGSLNSTAVADTSANANKVWKVNKCDIDAYHNWVLVGAPGANPVDSVTMLDILNWPVTEWDGSAGAPFFDANGDGTYDPTIGDYPLIKGDQAIYFVYNDKAGVHGETGGGVIGVEIQGMAYEYNCTDSALYNTVFVDYKIINKGTTQLHQAYIGSWTDFDIGAYNDDYIGCDVTRGAYYGYNGDGNDAGGYGTHPPAEAVVFLGGPYASPNFMDDPAESTANGTNYGDGVIDNERLGMTSFIAYANSSNATNGNPVLPAEYNNYLDGSWRDGSPLTYGGIGVATGAAAKYMFPGASDPTGFGVHGVAMSPWDEITESDTPGDRRGIGASGPFVLQPGAVHNVQLAYVFGRDYVNTGNVAGVTVMDERIDSVKAAYHRGISACGCNMVAAGIQQPASATAFSVYPNPASNLLYVNYKAQSKTALLEMFDVTGQLIRSEKITGSSTQTMDVSDLAKGLYVLKIQDGNTVSVKKFLKS